MSYYGSQNLVASAAFRLAESGQYSAAADLLKDQAKTIPMRLAFRVAAFVNMCNHRGRADLIGLTMDALHKSQYVRVSK